MESFIKDLNDYTDEPTKVMLQAVYKHKKKFDKFKRSLIICSWCSLVIFCLLFVYINYFILKLYGSDASLLFSVIIQDSIIYLLLICLLTLGGLGTYYKRKKEKSEKEYHELRMEIIRKSPELWRYPFGWEAREDVFKVMKEKKDINLYHESK